MKNSVFFPFSAPLGYSMDSYLLQLTDGAGNDNGNK